MSVAVKTHSTTEAAEKNAREREKTRNNRVIVVDRDAWQRDRNALFHRNVGYAANAKSYRTRLRVTQQEIAEDFGVECGTVSVWESGKYNWPGGADELRDYKERCRKIAMRDAGKVALKGESTPLRLVS